MDEAHPFRIKNNKQQGIICEGINKLPRKKRNALASKLRPVKLFKGDKILLYMRGVLVVNHDTDGRAI